MKSVVELWTACLKDAGRLYHVHVDRDIETALSRYGTEGLSFFTITLPRFEKDLLSAIRRGAVGSDLFCGFARRGGLPKFLGGFLRQMFHPTGKMRQFKPSLLGAVRQVLLLMGKIELSTTDARVKAAIDGYERTDAGIEAIDDSLAHDLRLVSRKVLDSFLSEVEARLYAGQWRPRHSSGALATRETYNGRFGFLTWTERLNEVLPWWDDMDLTPRQLSELDVRVLPRDDEPPVKVALVPKTMKAPRIIAEEPVWMQFVQQGLFRLFDDVVRMDRFTPLRDSFWWGDQEPNRALAREGSVDGSYATLDLSEASDRVGLSLVQAIFGDHAFLLRALEASRSETARLPDGRVIRLKKFASMGSALCFPVETMVFYIIIQLALQRHGLPVSTRVRVYGDDLIVPTHIAHTVIQLLEACGLKVNSDKSFTTSQFRESCGADWFRGENVSVFRLRKPPGDRRQAENFRSTIDFHNRAYVAGWDETAATAIALSGEKQPLFGPVGCDVSVFWSLDQDANYSFCTEYHRPRLKAYLFREVKPVDKASGEASLRKTLVPSKERHRDHLERDGRSRCVGTNIGWAHVPYS